ncbi:hypothetical protein [Epilithonimonas lactis]|uniref:PKD domain-containing protein n=1 Tax=Epilithonimonas lactis TaxID=421072 RepID=A0A085B6Y2_9FLAO|nr:hypothetical protein [Epilithonimonas lactis]KFC18227.1 hypothetical protein IO89_19075 [Epilithonimonas lactis]SER07805.1 hypothetical protein SAMN04488097_3818 [Epilithonimonas lactis]
MDKKKQFKNIVKSCENRFGRGDSASWKHSDFSDFSSEIQRATKISISVNTLKRIFGKISVDDNYLPQQATIEALKNYAGDYIDEDPIDQVNVSATENTTKSSSPNKSRVVRGVFLVLLLVLLGCLFLITKDKDLGEIKISSTEGLLPKTAVFDLELPSSDDSLFIDFGDKSAPIHLTKGIERISHTYLFPGVFKVEIKDSEKPLVETKIYVPSNKWLGLGFFRQREIPNSYYAFPAVRSGKDSVFHISNLQLQNAGLDTVKSYFTRLCNFTPIEKYSDNFVFETTFKNAKPNKAIYCNSMRFQISGIEQMIRFNFVSSGCSSKVLNAISEEIVSGNNTNLSRFVIDLEKWNTAKLINRNKRLQLYVNDKLIYEGVYKKSVGDLRGVFVEFEGNGYVKNCTLKSLEGKILYNF